jgi:hypothetical protein
VTCGAEMKVSPYNMQINNKQPSDLLCESKGTQMSFPGLINVITGPLAKEEHGVCAEVKMRLTYYKIRVHKNACYSYVILIIILALWSDVICGLLALDQIDLMPGWWCSAQCVRNAFSSSTQPPRTKQPLLNWVNIMQSELLAVQTIMPSGESKQCVDMSQIRKGTVTIEVVLRKAHFRGLLGRKGPVKD